MQARTNRLRCLSLPQGGAWLGSPWEPGHSGTTRLENPSVFRNRLGVMGYK